MHENGWLDSYFDDSERKNKTNEPSAVERLMKRYRLVTRADGARLVFIIITITTIGNGCLSDARGYKIYVI